MVSFSDNLEKRVKFLLDEDQGDVDLYITLFAVRAYVRKNLVAHGRNFNLYQSGRFDDSACQVEEGDKNLESLFPDQERSQVGKYRRLLILSGFEQMAIKGVLPEAVRNTNRRGVKFQMDS